MKRERWTESDIINLPAEEAERFDRKSGRLFKEQDQFLNDIAKALSAFANSGGGSLLLGVEDNGNLDGIRSHFGRTSIKDWIEQRIPTLLDYPLSDFRVHTVEKADNSTIPEGLEVIVIDVGDSAAAPHQSKRNNRYYYRSGGRSEPAPHFYLELLRQRLTHARLEFDIEAVEFVGVTLHEGRLYFLIDLVFSITNVGRVASYHWLIIARTFSNDGEEFPFDPHDCLKFSNFLIKNPRDDSIEIDRTILPGINRFSKNALAIFVPITQKTPGAVREKLRELLSVGIGYQLATENSPGSVKKIVPLTVIDVDELVSAAQKNCATYFAQE